MLLIAHRGASGYAPENTIGAFKKAIEMGAKAIEFDVQVTKDNQVVVIHDFTLERTTTGKGYVMDKTLEEIKSYDAGSWFSNEFKGEKVPTLSEVIDIIPEDVIMNVEIKKAVFEKRNVEEYVVEVLKEKNRINNSIISAFDHFILERIMKKDIIKTGTLLDNAMINTVDYLETRGLKSYSINQAKEFVSEELVKEAHDNELKVYSYTVNDVVTAKLFERMGVDGIFTNYLDILDWEIENVK